jgi:hypothetical protein
VIRLEDGEEAEMANCLYEGNDDHEANNIYAKAK